MTTMVMLGKILIVLAEMIGIVILGIILACLIALVIGTIYGLKGGKGDNK